MVYVPSKKQQASRHGTRNILIEGCPKGISLTVIGNRLYLRVRYKRKCDDELFFSLHVKDYYSMSACYDAAVLKVIANINLTTLEQFLLWNTRNQFRKHYGFTRAEFELPFRAIRKIYPESTGFAIFA